MFASIIELLDKGDVADARKTALHAMVLQAAREGVFNWINHPEYLDVEEIRENGREITATVYYGGETQKIEFRR